MILLVAGTSDARQLAIEMKKEDLTFIATVVTESGASKLRNEGINVRVGRLTKEQFVSFIKEKKITIVVDASHPYAQLASLHAMEAAKETNIPYVRYERQSVDRIDDERITYVEGYKEAAEVAKNRGGVILLTVGSKSLPIFTEILLPEDNITLYVRLLPNVENMSLCNKLQIPQKNIIAIQGPFSKAFNLALFKEYQISLHITKESGKEGSFLEKLSAATQLGIETVIINRPKLNYEIVFSTICSTVAYIKGRN